MLKDTASVSQLADDDTDVFQKCLIDRHKHRPQALNSMYLAEVGLTYVVKYEHIDCDTLPAPESYVTSSQTTQTIVDWAK